MRGEDSPLLAFTARHHGRDTAGGVCTGRTLGFLEPLLKDLFDGGSVGGTQLHLLKAADGALSEITKASVGKGLPH